MSISYSCVKCGVKLKPKEMCHICFPKQPTSLNEQQIDVVRHLYQMTVSKMRNQSHIYTSDDILELKNDITLNFPNDSHRIISD